MIRLEDLSRGAVIRGILPHGLVTVVDLKWYGTSVVELTYKDSTGQPGNQLLYHDDGSRLEIVTEGRPWSFDADGALLRLVSEAQRIRLAHLFDPYLAVHTSQVEPLPHQITAVYEDMLPRQPLRFLLADDPGAGKTIMTGLLVRELLVRGDISRCLIVCPGNLVEQWQDELYQRFNLPFEILTNTDIEAARSGNVFQEKPLLIARLDKLSRDEELQTKLGQTDWDLIVCDEAHKMSATYFGNEVKYTKRYHLGQLLGQITRHFLLLTATPHNGKEKDFQLFMALLDSDRFEGRFRDGVHTVNAADLMRRLSKEQLLKFNGAPLFPERLAYTVPYHLSDQESVLYKQVTEYVQEEFNRADKLDNEGRKGTVGFALTILQRRLASSPEAIYQSLKRRRERLEQKLREEMLNQRATSTEFIIDQDTLEELDDTPNSEVEALEEELVDLATAARTIAELRAEIITLKGLEELSLHVRINGTDRKWEELSGLLQSHGEMFDAEGHRHKLVIFTEHRDTLNYLSERIRALLGRPEAVVTIHGSLGRESRAIAQASFTQDKNTLVLVATDAAGEGINLQRAHLMINYDLPWNPNRLEQRFGRIHRIGQDEVCHMWNLVTEETREGEVYQTLLRKLERERQSLGGAVFDVLGKAIGGAELRRLLIEAIRYGDRPDVRARLTQVVEGALDQTRLQSLLEERALARDAMDTIRVQNIHQQMKRLEARRLQPHFIASFFKAAFEHLGGTLREREPERYEITYVPGIIRQRDRLIGRREPVLPHYERICFEKELIRVVDKPPAAFICPGHPLLDTVLDLILERYRDLFKQGAVLLDEYDLSETPRALFHLQHDIQDAHTDTSGRRRIVSRRLQFIEFPITDLDASVEDTKLRLEDSTPRSGIRDAGPAPYLDYRPLTTEEQAVTKSVIDHIATMPEWEMQAVSYAIKTLVSRHLDETRELREPLVIKTRAAVQDRLTKEIMYWDHRAEELKAQEATGKVNARLNSSKAHQRADELRARLQKRLQELDEERQLSALPPVALGGALVLPKGLLERLQGQRKNKPEFFARETKRVEEAAIAAVMAVERQLGYIPTDVRMQNLGYNIESVCNSDGKEHLRFIEVKGRITGTVTVTISKNEILTAFNEPDDWILALVEVPPTNSWGPESVFMVNEPSHKPSSDYVVRYIRHIFTREPDFNAASVNYNWDELWQQGWVPSKQM